MRRSLPRVRSLNLAITRRFAPFLAAWVIGFGYAIAQEQGVDEGGEDVLVLSVVCSKEYYDTPRISQCLARQQAKADRWLQAVVGSYAGWATKEMDIRKGYGGNPPDLVSQLQRSQAAFDLYRTEAAELVRQSIDGSIAPLEQSRTSFDLTVDRARFLLGKCGHPAVPDPIDKVDLTITDWCR